ncbi:polymerase [Nostoc minutum NIES-26]|uniref:Polymerase n=1 Tax=Nostoc minutum NIES-26 TaxID=1844469 RepID=A0A367R9X8_9NOSO|nr:polymerase [Nostoc minutum NIES-26]
MKKLLIFAEYALTVLCLLHYSGGPLAVLISGGINEGEVQTAGGVDNSLVLALFFLTYVLFFFLLVARWKKVIYVLSKDRFIWALFGLVVLSICWSVNPSKTITRIIALTGTTMFGLYLATRYTMKEQLKLLTWMFGIAIMLSFVFAVALPKFGIMGGLHAGSWRGIYYHKNGLGLLMALSTIIFFIQVIDARKNRWIVWFGCSLSVILLLLSTAKSSLTNCIIVLAICLTCQILRWNYDWMIPGFTGVATIAGSLYILLTTNLDTLLASIGKDTSLTGRTDIWPLVLNAIGKRPWQGYGFGAFWGEWNSEASRIWNAAGWPVPNSHNGFLDVWLQLGILGLLLLALSFFATLIRALLCIRHTTTSTWLWPLLYFSYIFLVSLGESTLMNQNDLLWVLYVAIAYTLLLPIEEQVSHVNFKK